METATHLDQFRCTVQVPRSCEPLGTPTRFPQESLFESEKDLPRQPSQAALSAFASARWTISIPGDRGSCRHAVPSV